MSETTILLAGLPSAGKTTYLAALFHLLRSKAPNVASLSMPDLPEERDYLMEAESAWLRFQPLTRTVTPSPGGAVIPFERDGRPAQLSIPDVRGEDYEALWEYGARAEHLVEIASSAHGLMLVIRADDVREPEFLDMSPEFVDGATFALEDWNPEEAPTQTKLCDVLEQLGVLVRGVPTAVLVTAWDTQTVDESPVAWLQRRLPLLWQLLDTSNVRCAVFGISAQGGDVEDSDELARLASLENSSSRISDPAVRRGEDLTAPIAWLLSED